MSQEIKDKCTAMIEKLETNIKRETGISKELADDYAGIAMVGLHEENLTPLPVDCNFKDWEEMKEKFSSEIAKGTGDLSRIEENKIEIEALQYYVDNN